MATKKSPPRPNPSRSRSDASQAAADASQAAAEAIRDLVVEKAAKAIDEKTAKLERKLNAKAARQQERVSQKAAHHIEQLDRLAAHLDTLDIWTRAEPTGRRPRFTRAQIAAAAVRIADAEGSDALSMRRLASELDAGTMTLYHYIRTKDELLALVMDEIMGEIVLHDDEELPASWRDAVTVIANRSRAVLQAHPWILDITDDPAIGPNSVRHFDQTLQAVSSLPGDLGAKLDVVTAVDEYVFGYCLHERNHLDDEAGDAGMFDYVVSLLQTGEYPALTALAEEVGLEQAWEQIEAHQRSETRFDRNLGRLLDGFEADLR